ncbi:hypothetical protein C6359_12760 [Bacillus wiedmannii]|uniref:Uncharacterized protein n=1 Tax=Bacillus wiedmannii TaxID=1890302 RepID=A0A2A7DW72_9BACI|nr:hypothetical protein CON82_02925 [Bacillus wiedmannii]PHD63529.1 hypothetical protein COF57_00185 [Bacillus wiedmannii]PRT05436.1 hypothetical protein C6356_08650 [Bacillus wiedmannii]PRT35088.1 hypothetical protein C6358_12700 [Bacillus wiedmannii]PRT40709.1 hypothetical protein C6357_06510 [Bacillus wiedmannii]
MMIVPEIISTIFRIYLSKPAIYQRFFKYIYRNSKYINDSTRNIDLPKKTSIPFLYKKRLSQNGTTSLSIPETSQ